MTSPADFIDADEPILIEDDQGCSPVVTEYHCPVPTEAMSVKEWLEFSKAFSERREKEDRDWYAKVNPFGGISSETPDDVLPEPPQMSPHTVRVSEDGEITVEKEEGYSE